MEINRSFYKPVELKPLVGLFASELSKATLTVCRDFCSEAVSNVDRYGGAAIFEAGLAMQSIAIWLGSEGHLAPGVVIFLAGLIPEALGGSILVHEAYGKRSGENVA